MKLTIEDDTILTKLRVDIENIPKNDSLMLNLHTIFRNYMNKYIPFNTGNLSRNVNVTPDYIEYNQPYAHYMYEGIIYGPNIPVKDEQGNIIKWVSPPTKKFPTGRSFKYTNPLATRHWDEAVINNEGEQFTSSIENEIILALTKELDNG